MACDASSCTPAPVRRWRRSPAACRWSPCRCSPTRCTTRARVAATGAGLVVDPREMATSSPRRSSRSWRTPRSRRRPGRSRSAWPHCRPPPRCWRPCGRLRFTDHVAADLRAHALVGRAAELAEVEQRPSPPPCAARAACCCSPARRGWASPGCSPRSAPRARGRVPLCSRGRARARRRAAAGGQRGGPVWLARSAVPGVARRCSPFRASLARLVPGWAEPGAPPPYRTPRSPRRGAARAVRHAYRDPWCSPWRTCTGPTRRPSTCSTGSAGLPGGRVLLAATWRTGELDVATHLVGHPGCSTWPASTTGPAPGWRGTAPGPRSPTTWSTRCRRRPGAAPAAGGAAHRAGRAGCSPADLRRLGAGRRAGARGAGRAGRAGGRPAGPPGQSGPGGAARRAVAGDRDRPPAAGRGWSTWPSRRCSASCAPGCESTCSPPTVPGWSGGTPLPGTPCWPPCCPPSGPAVAARIATGLDRRGERGPRRAADLWARRRAAGPGRSALVGRCRAPPTGASLGQPSPGPTGRRSRASPAVAEELVRLLTLQGRLAEARSVGSASLDQLAGPAHASLALTLAEVAVESADWSGALALLDRAGAGGQALRADAIRADALFGSGDLPGCRGAGRVGGGRGRRDRLAAGRPGRPVYRARGGRPVCPGAGPGGRPPVVRPGRAGRGRARVDAATGPRTALTGNPGAHRRAPSHRGWSRRGTWPRPSGCPARWPTSTSCWPRPS